MIYPASIKPCFAMLLFAAIVLPGASLASAAQPPRPAPDPPMGANDGEAPSVEASPRVVKAHPPMFVSDADERSAALLKKLRETNVTWKFGGISLGEWQQQYVEKELNVNIIFDQRALGEEGIDLTTPLSFEITNASAEVALAAICRNLGVRYLFEDGSILITSNLACGERLPLRIYDATDFALHPRGVERSMASLIETIQSIDPDQWDVMGGSASATYTEGENAVVLHVSASMEMQFEIERFLEKLRQIEEFHRPQP